MIDRDNVAPGTLDALLDESRRLRGDVHSAEQARRTNAHINLGLLGVVAALVVLLLVVTVQNNSLAHQVKNTNDRISDCTTPGGACYDQGTKRTGQAVGSLIRAEAAVAECARLYPDESGPAYDRNLEACVAARLAPPAVSQSPAPTPRGTR